MELQSSAGFATALAFGMLVIWFHAWSQFNTPSYKNSVDFERVLKRLVPSDMRRESVYIQAYVFYATVLTSIYLLICLYGSIPLLQQLLPVDIPGLDLVSDRAAGAEKLPQAGASFDDSNLGETAASGPPAALPLAVALAVVGLAPNVPLLAQVESWIRGQAHRLSGIPAHLVDYGFRLQRNGIHDETTGRWLHHDKGGWLISVGDWALVETAHASAEGLATLTRDNLRKNLLSLLALRNWVLDGQVLQPEGRARYAYQSVEQDLQAAIDLLLEDVEGTAGRSDLHKAARDPKKAELDDLRRRWRDLNQRAETLCGDVCALIALYSEKGALAGELRQARDAGAGAGSQAERSRIGRILGQMLERAGHNAERINIGMTIFSYILPVLLIVGVLLALGLPDMRVTDEIDDGFGVLGRIGSYGVTYLLLYAVPLFAVLSAQQERLRRDAWHNWHGDRPARALAQYLVVAGIAVLITMIGMVGYNLYNSIAAGGLQKVIAEFPAALNFAISLEFPRVLKGVGLAVAVALLVDLLHQGAGGRDPHFACRARRVVVGTVIAMSVAGGVERGLSLVTRDDFWRLVGREMLASGLLALTVMFFVMLLLQEEGGRTAAPTAAPGRPAGLGRPLFIGAMLVLVLAQPALAQADGADRMRLVIGVRSDARPFAWSEKGAGALAARGYLADLCMAAATRAGHDFELRQISAAQRSDILNAPSIDLGGLDLLCDPVTLSLSRASRLSDRTIYSPILFLANGTFVQRPDPEPCNLGEARTTAVPTPCLSVPTKKEPPRCHGAEAAKIWPRGDCSRVETVVWPPACAARRPADRAYLRIGVTAGTNAREMIQRARDLNLLADGTLCIAEYAEHSQGLKGFCAGRLHYYFGDRDILQATLDHLTRESRPCPYKFASRGLSYEPYGILIATTRGLGNRVVHALYGLHSDGSADGLFNAYFTNGKSAPLEMLLRLNSIPANSVP